MEINRDLLVKIGLGVAAVIVLLAVLSFIMGLVRFLLPIALVVLIGYFGYQWWRNRESKEVTIEKKTDNIQTERYEKKIKAKQSDQKDTPAVVVSEAKSKTVTVEDNGFGAPVDISRLEDKEKEQPKITDDVRAQIEERRKRLGLD